MIIYRIANTINKRLYIGLTSQPLKRRYEQHLFCARNGINSALYNAMRKHGENNFFIEEIAKASSEDELKKLEQEYIAKFDTYRTGYNMTLGGEGSFGYVPTEETRKKLGALRIGYKHTEQTKKKQSDARIGRPNKAVAGENHPSAKLSDAQRIEIAHLYEETDTSLATIAKLYGINKASAYAVVKKFFPDQSLEDVGPRKRPHVLTEADKKAIRTKYAKGNVTQRSIAKEYGVTPTVILRLVTDLPKNNEWRKSEKASGRKISDSTRLKIYEDYKKGITQKRIAEKYGIAEITVSRLVRRVGQVKSKHAGATHFNSKLSEKDWKKIYQIWMRGKTTKTDIAARFGVSNRTVATIIQRVEAKGRKTKAK